MRGADVVTERRAESESDDSCGTVSASLRLTQTTAGHDADYTPYLSDGCDSARPAQHRSEVGEQMLSRAGGLNRAASTDWDRCTHHDAAFFF